jgi:hypothetical protein
MQYKKSDILSCLSLYLISKFLSSSLSVDSHTVPSKIYL